VTFGRENMQLSKCLDHGFMPCYSSPSLHACGFMVVLCVMTGPGEEARGDARSEHFRDDISTAVRLLSVEDCQAFAITMELVDDLEDNHVYFQIVARYTSMHQAEVTRVITVRLPTTDILLDYLQSVDDEVLRLMNVPYVV
jgi:protein transport protein SEC23